MQEKPCDHCKEQKASTQCEVCGSIVCSTCKMDYGCKACNGGEQSF